MKQRVKEESQTRFCSSESSVRDATRRDGFTENDAKEDRRVVGFYILVQSLRDERTNAWGNFFQDETVRELFVCVNDECDDDELDNLDEGWDSDEIERGTSERKRVVLGDAKGWVRVRGGGFELRTVLRETFGARGRGV